MPSRTRTPQPQEPPSPADDPRRPRTLWEEGQHPGRLVVRFAVVTLTLVTCASLLVGDQLGVPFDLVFTGLCVGAALWVRPSDFFVIGVMPPLLLTGTVLVLALVARGSVARPDDALGQAVVSGLAHHAIALTVGYGLTLIIIGLRQVALRNHGVIRVNP